MKVRKKHTRFLCGSLAAAAAISPILSMTAWADNQFQGKRYQG